MKIDIKFAEVHTQIFLAGVNLGTKLDPKKRSDLSLVFDDAKDKLYVRLKNETTIVPSSNIVHVQPADPKHIDFGKNQPLEFKGEKDVYQPKSHPMKAGLSGAQVSTPTDHVFKGTT